MKARMLPSLVLVLLTSFSVAARANGTKPIGNVAMKAILETSTGETNQIFNACIGAGTNEVTELEAKSGAARQIIRLSRIEKLVYVEFSPANTNYAVFDVLLKGASASRRLELKIIDGATPLNLKGMTSDRTRFEVPLTDCKTVVFSPQGELHKDPAWPVGTSSEKK
jgi:hypothetical protein